MWLFLILNLIPQKTTEYLVYDVIQSYGYLILSEEMFWSAQIDVDQLVFQESTDIVEIYFGLDSEFVSAGLKGLRM